MVMANSFTVAPVLVTTLMVMLLKVKPSTLHEKLPLVYRLDGALMQDAALAGATNATNAVVLSSSLRMSHLRAPVPADAKQANGGDQARQAGAAMGPGVAIASMASVASTASTARVMLISASHPFRRQVVAHRWAAQGSSKKSTARAGSTAAKKIGPP